MCLFSITPWYKRRRSSHIPRVSLTVVGTKDSGALTYSEYLRQLWVQKAVELSHTQSISSSCGYERQQCSHIPRTSLAVVGTKDSGALTYPECFQQLWVQKKAEFSHTQGTSGSCASGLHSACVTKSLGISSQQDLSTPCNTWPDCSVWMWLAIPDQTALCECGQQGLSTPCNTWPDWSVWMRSARPDPMLCVNAVVNTACTV